MSATGGTPESARSQQEVQTQQDEYGDYAVVPVPAHARRSTLSVALVAAGFSIAMSGLFTGAAMAAGLSLPQAIAAAVLGNCILAAYGGLVGAAGARHGVSTTMLSRHAFGRQGAKVIGATWAITLIGWYAVQTGFFGQTINALWPGGGVFTIVPVAALWGGLLMITTPYFGFRGLRYLSATAVPLLLIFSLWGIVRSAQGTDLASYVPPEPFSLATGITLAVGSFAVGAVVQADITRYARSASAAWLATILGYVVANSYIIAAGAITMMATNEDNLPAAMLAVGLGAPALLTLILAQWTTNDNNLYSASLGLANIIKAKKHHMVLVSGIVATGFGVWGLADHLVPWLTALGTVIPPVAGILIADYWVLRRGSYDFGPGTTYASWNWAAFAAWIVASAVGFLLDAGIPSVNSIVVAFVAYLGFAALSDAVGRASAVGETVEETSGF